MSIKKHKFFIKKVEKGIAFIYRCGNINLVLKKRTTTSEKLDISEVMMAKRSHPFPYRTRKLSSLAPMVVGGFPLRE